MEVENSIKISVLLEIYGELLTEKKCEVKMLESHDKWYGVTYQEDKPSVKAGIASLYEKGCYPKPLWK